MTPVLDIDNLLESPLSDLHAIAGELDIEGYRLLKKPDLTIAILESRGAIGDEIRPAVEAKATELGRIRAEREKALADKEEAEEAEREAARQEAAAERARGGSRGQRGGRGRRGGSAAGEKQTSGRTPRGRGGRQQQAKAEAGAAAAAGSEKSEKAPKERRDEPTTPLAGVFEPGSGGGGRLRTDLTRRVRGDADVPRGEVRRWNLTRGDLINAQVKKARRGRTDFVVGSIDSVNGQHQEARKQPAQPFEKRDAVAIAGRYAKKTFKHAPIGAGSRLVVTGPTRAAASEMLKKLAGELASDGVVTTLVIVTARPEQSEAMSGVEVIAGDATKAPEDVLPALELALDRDRRLAETGRDTAVLVDGLDLLPAEKANEIFVSARNLAQGGALTIAASAGAGSPLEAQASAIGVVAGGRKLKLDKKASWSGN
ncbi:MAG: Rho termination factor N-terminal domain-containing protein [Solirubrobacterales bacterium]